MSLRRIRFWNRMIRLFLLSISTSRILPVRFLLSNDLFYQIMFLHYFYSFILPFLHSPKLFSVPFLFSIFHSSFLVFFHPFMSSRQLFPHFNFLLFGRPSLFYFPFSLSFFLGLSIFYNLLLSFFLLSRVFSFLLCSKGRQIMPLF